jgi:hypothetical protein
MDAGFSEAPRAGNIANEGFKRSLGMGWTSFAREGQCGTMKEAEKSSNPHLKHKNGTENYHDDGITCREYPQGFDAVHPSIDICRSDNGSEIWDRHCKIDRDCEHVRR